MFRPAALFIGLRYTRSKRRHHFVSFISLMSMLGIALGMIVLITVLSVMNGFNTEIQKQVFSMWPALTVSSSDNFLKDWQELEKVLQKNSDIKAVAPFISGQILITHSDYVSPAILNGIDPMLEKKISELSQKMTSGTLGSLLPKSFGIVLGEELASHLKVKIGDKVTIVTPRINFSAAGVSPHFNQFKVTGIFKAASRFNFDTGLAYINLNDAQTLFQMGNTVSGLHATVYNIFAAPSIADHLSMQLNPNIQIANWTSQFGPFFQAIQLQKSSLFLVLLLIIAIAVFNLISTLIMIVNEKEADIAILRTYGATRRTVMLIFIVQGMVVGMIGTVLGVIGGILLAENVTTLVNWIQAVLHVQLISASVYFIDYLPSEIHFYDVFEISCVALSLSLMATIYPAWRASRTTPVDALRYD